MGDKKKFDSILFGRAVSSVIKRISSTKAKNIVFSLDSFPLSINKLTIRTFIIAVETSLYAFSLKQPKNDVFLNKCVLFSRKNISSREFSDSVKISKSISNGINKAKDLGNMPPNICTPTFLSNEAKKLRKINKIIKIDIFDEKKMKTLKMGSFLSVSKGSKEPAKLITIKYLPIKNKQPIVLSLIHI